MKGGTAAMSATRYKRGTVYASDMAEYARTMSSDNSAQIHRMKANLTRALKQDVTELQQLYLYLYYDQGLTMQEIGNRMGVHKSTVSRTIKRGEERLARCIRYGAPAILRASMQETW